jgi:predicted branched-subunit amino acid permease
MTGPRSEFLSGVRDELPILVGVVPFGMIYGIIALGAGLSPLEAQAMSAVVFAGSSQLIAVQLAGLGTPGLVIVLTGFVVNLRHALYSASVAPYIRHLSPVWKALLAYLLTDEAYAVTIAHYRSTDATRKPSFFLSEAEPESADPAAGTERSERDLVGNWHWYFLGAGLALWSTWQASTAMGILLGAQIPGSWGLDFTLALTFIALVVPLIDNRPTLLAALTAALVSVLAADLPYRLSLMVAALAGILVGLALEGRRR